jgi:hypothetical protein
VPAAALAGGINGLLWAWAVRIAVLHKRVRLPRVPVFPIVVTLVIAFMFTLGNATQTGTPEPERTEPLPLSAVEAKVTGGPVLFLAGYNSHYSGAATGRTLPILRYSYAGSDPDGRPVPYPEIATHQSLVTSAQRLSVQVDRVSRSTGRQVSLLAQSEGALVAHYYLATMPHPQVSRLALLSPPIHTGRAYYPPPQAHTGWGIATGWELRAVYTVLGLAGGVRSKADEPFIRSLLDNAPLFRGAQMLCPVSGVEVVAFLSTWDSSAVPPGLRAGVPIVQVPGPHGLLIDSPDAQSRLVNFLNSGKLRQRRTWEHGAILRSGAAWQAPTLAISLNPAWRDVAGQPGRASRRRCAR